MKPIASVIIPNLNGRVWLDRCIQSLLAQTLQPVEIILVDQNSNDGSADYVAETFPQVRLIRQPQDRGFTGACNDGIEAAAGGFIALFNTDARAEPDWLEVLAKAMGKDETTGSAACKTLDYDDSARIYSLGDGFLPNGDAFNIARGMRDRPDLPMPRFVFGGSGCTVVYRRSALDHVGLLDEDFYTFHEDVDLNLRLQLAGYKCLYVPEAVAYHAGYATGRKTNDRLAFISGRNRWFVLLKNWPWRLWLRFAPQLARRQAQVAWWALKGSRTSRARCRGALSALRSLPRELRKRRAVQRLRRVGAGELVAMLQAHGTLRRQLQAIADQETKAEHHG
ncbi:MAG: glycosyltransferase family 2 protein [Verrucomicrobia bacterium]|nr:glycosyltransferase family 2 protein [Verrucomicrobiota bacterium]